MHESAQSNDSIEYSLRRQYIDNFFCRVAKNLPSGSLVLDLGGKRFRKRGYFNIESFPVRTVYLNNTAVSGPHVVADAAKIACKAGAFGAVICSELLEHVPDPGEVVREAYRVLAPNGLLLICVPFLYRIHPDPHDYGRYTDHYWRELLTANGFTIISIEKQGLFWSVLIDMLRELLVRTSNTTLTGTVAGKRIIRFLFRRARRKAVTWDACLAHSAHSPLTGYTTGFGIVAQKL